MKPYIIPPAIPSQTKGKEHMVDLNEHRKYIHDLANNFSILDASVHRALTLLSRSHPELNDEITRLKKADEYIKKSIHTLKAFREHIHKQLGEQVTEVPKQP